MYREVDFWSGSVNVDLAMLQKYTACLRRSKRIVDRCRGIVTILPMILLNAPVDYRHLAGLSVCLSDACVRIAALFLYPV